MEAPLSGPSRPRPLCRFAVVVSLASITVAAGQEKLQAHSFESPPDIRALANDWFLAGTAIPSTEHVILTPGVPQRVGLMWHKFPLLTNNFEVEFAFVDRGENPTSVSDNGLAFWYVYENATEAQMSISKDHLHSQEHVTANLWMSAMRAKGFHLLGYRSQFDGLGVFFCNSNATEPGESRQATPVVSAIVNEGIRPYKLWRGIPTRSAQKVDYRDGKETTVNIRVEPASVTVKINGGLEIPKIQISKPMKAGGFIGFSTHSGMKGSPDPKERGDYIAIKRLAITNHDTSQKGETVPDRPKPAKEDKPTDKEDLLHETSSFKDHRGESDAIKELTNMVFKLVVESQPLRTEMSNAISSISRRMTTMEQQFKQLKEDLDKTSGHKLDAEFDAMKKELVSLSQYASSETKERHSKLDTLHKDISQVHKASSIFGPDHIDKHLSQLEEGHKRTLENLKGEHQKMFGVSIAAIAFIVIAGLSLYNKFRCWEKKHVI